MKFNKSLDWLKESDKDDNLLADDELDVVEEEMNEGLYVDPSNYDKHKDLVDVVDKAGNPQKMTQATYNKNKNSGEFEKKEPEKTKEPEKSEEPEKTKEPEKSEEPEKTNNLEEVKNTNEIFKNIKESKTNKLVSDFIEDTINKLGDGAFENIKTLDAKKDEIADYIEKSIMGRKLSKTERNNIKSDINDIYWNNLNNKNVTPDTLKKDFALKVRAIVNNYSKMYNPTKKRIISDIVNDEMLYLIRNAKELSASNLSLDYYTRSLENIIGRDLTQEEKDGFENTLDNILMKNRYTKQYFNKDDGNEKYYNAYRKAFEKPEFAGSVLMAMKSYVNNFIDNGNSIVMPNLDIDKINEIVDDADIFKLNSMSTKGKEGDKKYDKFNNEVLAPIIEKVSGKKFSPYEIKNIAGSISSEFTKSRKKSNFKHGVYSQFDPEDDFLIRQNIKKGLIKGLIDAERQTHKKF